MPWNPAPGLALAMLTLFAGTPAAAQSYDWDVLVMNIDWGSGGLFEEAVLEEVFMQAGEFWNANSYGAVTLTPDVITVTLPEPECYYKCSCSEPCVPLLGAAMADALGAAAAAGKNPADYEFHALMNDIVLSSSGSAGGKVWMGTTKKNVISHELTHSLDVKHSNARDVGGPLCGLQECLAPLCAATLVPIEYGNIYDTIGLSGMFFPNSHLNPRVKFKLGWLTENEVRDVCQTGQHTIQAHDLPLVGMDPAALRVPIDADTNYWVEYRQRIQDPLTNVEEGVLVVQANNDWGYWNSPGYQQSLLIDMHKSSVPGSNWEAEALDAALELGEKACLPGMNIEVLALDPTGTPPTATVKITKSNQCPAAVDQPSAIAIQSPVGSTSTVGPGAVTFLATAHDPDAGVQNGDGIEEVQFSIMELTGSEVPILTFEDDTVPYEWVLDAPTVATLTTKGYVLLVRAVSEASAGGHFNSVGTFFMVDPLP